MRTGASRYRRGISSSRGDFNSVINNIDRSYQYPAGSMVTEAGDGKVKVASPPIINPLPTNTFGEDL